MSADQRLQHMEIHDAVHYGTWFGVLAPDPERGSPEPRIRQQQVAERPADPAPSRSALEAPLNHFGYGAAAHCWLMAA